MANDLGSTFNTNIIITIIVLPWIVILPHYVATVIDTLWNKWSGKPKPIIPIYKNAQSYWIVLILACYAVITYFIIKYMDVKTKEVKRKSLKKWKSDMDMTIINPSITALTWAVAIISIFSIYAVAV